MGVEVKLIIGELSKHTLADTDVRWMHEISSIDLSVPGSNAQIGKFDASKYPSAFFYTGEGEHETTVLEDCYGTKLFAIPIKEFVKVFRQDCEASRDDYGGEMYRRFSWALPLLTRMKNDRPVENLSVIMYWH